MGPGRANARRAVIDIAHFLERDSFKWKPVEAPVTL